MAKIHTEIVDTPKASPTIKPELAHVNGEYMYLLITLI